MKRTILACLTAVLASGTAVGQQTPQSRVILQTISLPRVSEILREKGIPAEEVEEAVISARRRGLPPDETAVILEEAATSVDENGPIDNFGAFVQEQLDNGLRGRDLAAAIHAEHARRGIGKGRKLPGKGKDESGQLRERGPGPDASGRPDTLDPARRRGPGTAGRRPPDSTATNGRRPTAPQGGMYEE